MTDESKEQILEESRMLGFYAGRWYLDQMEWDLIGDLEKDMQEYQDLNNSPMQPEERSPQEAFESMLSLQTAGDDFGDMMWSRFWEGFQDRIIAHYQWTEDPEQGIPPHRITREPETRQELPMEEGALFEEVAEEQGWTMCTQVYVLLEYISNQQSPEAFEDFLRRQQDMEEEL